MANVANTKATGPTSKDAVSGGTQFPLNQKDISLGGGNGFNLGTGSEEAQRAIMSLRIASTGYSSDVEGGLKRQKAPR